MEMRRGQQAWVTLDTKAGLPAQQRLFSVPWFTAFVPFLEERM